MHRHRKNYKGYTLLQEVRAAMDEWAGGPVPREDLDALVEDLQEIARRREEDERFWASFDRA